ncbi:MAG: glycoside hydrolase family 3 N-terminal domain-containing protein [Pyrinomonadaceae bacterium]
MNSIRLTRLALIAVVVFVFLLAPVSPSQSQRPKDVEKRIDALLAKMTLAEKLGQLQQLDGEGNGTFRPEHPELVRKGLLGSTLNVRGAKNTNQLQHVAMDESRLKIPVLFGFDVIHGYRTIFPIPLAEASSWDPALAERSTSIAAQEAHDVGLRWTFAPMLDIARDPRWGRITEGAGEDPYLAAAFARARVRGFQGNDYSAPNKILACAKHWVAYGAAEGGRDYNTTDMSENTLREVYFPPFKAAVDAGVGTVMSAFNDLNGVPTSANPFTLTKVLRGEWKFEGFVVSDYTSVKELINHGLAANDKDAARAALTAGVDMEMVSRLFNQQGPALLREAQLSQATIDEAVRRILRIKFRLGLFEHPYTDEARESSSLLTPENRAAARVIADRSLVLLKNEREALPLSKAVHSIAVIGPLADDKRAPLGWWSGDGKPEDTITPLTGIRANVSLDTKVSYAKGCDVLGDSTAGFAEAVTTARDSDVAIVFVGETAETVGEAAAKSSLDLTGRQMDLVKAVYATGKPTVVVLMNGRPLTIGWIADNVPAILEAWMGGSESGNAIADVLFGDVNPGGKLPVTWPRTVGQVPIYYNHMNTGRPPEANNRYTSKYLDVPWTPQFPFGYGLSYTRFKITNLQLSAQQVRSNGTLTARVEVENVGKRAGDEVVQLYIRDVAASMTRPVKELKGFQRVTLQPGEKKHVEFTLTAEQLGFWNRELRFVVEPGEFKVMVGSDSEELIETKFEVGAR